MKVPKNQLKTWNSQQSDIDMFSRLQNQFMQKFFRFNLIDYFDDMLLNLYETAKQNRTQTNKNNKALLSHMFEVKESFMLQEFEQKMHKFYKSRSKTFDTGELQHVFKVRYCNMNPVPNHIKKGQMVLFDIKIKADIEKLQKIPHRVITELEEACKVSKVNPAKAHSNSQANQDVCLKNALKSYRGEYMNIFIVYFGDINFHLVRKEQYEKHYIELFDQKVKLRIFTFFISKQALLESFRMMNKITNLDHINDLVIQFYEIKRDKLRQKKLREKQKKVPRKENTLLQRLTKDKTYLVGGASVVLVMAVAAGVAVYKLKG